ASNDPLGLRGGFYWWRSCLAAALRQWRLWAFVKRGARKYAKFPAPCSFVGVPATADRNVPEEAGQDGTMDRIVLGVALIERQRPDIAERLFQLRVQVLPL